MFFKRSFYELLHRWKTVHMSHRKRDDKTECIINFFLDDNLLRLFQMKCGPKEDENVILGFNQVYDAR